MNKAFEKILEKLEDMRIKSCIPDIKGYCQATISKAEEVVKEVAEEYNGDWIPCSERLPEEPNTTGYAEEDYFDGKLTEYIVMILGAKKATTLYYAGDGHWYDVTSQEYYPVIAWQQLPEPYE